MNISMPDDMRRFVKERTKQGGFSTPTEYVRSLIRADRERIDKQRLEAMLLAGIDSGEAANFNEADWAEIRRAAKRRLSKKARS